MTRDPRTTFRSPRRTLSVFLVLGALSSIFLDYWEYSRSFHSDPDIWASALRGAADAPAQYRIGVLKAAEFVTHHSPLQIRHALTIFDVIFLLVAMFVLRDLLMRSSTWREAAPAVRWFGAAAFLVLLGYSLQWLTWYQRPETLTIAALLALSLWLSTNRLPIPGVGGNLATVFALIVLGLLQGVTRADVGVTFHLGVVLVCLTPLGRSFALPRWLQCLASLGAAGVAGGVQFYIMHFVYPNATYGTTPRFQLLLNYTDHIRMVPFALFLIPSVWLAIQVFQRRFTPQPAQAGLLVGAAMFLILWCVLGKVDEVRIFLPFAFALAPMTVEAAMARISLGANQI